MRRYLIIFAVLLLGTISAGAQNFDRGYENIPSSPFVKKGTWVAGGTLSYSQHVNDGHSILLINNINSNGYSVSVNPKVVYMLKDNMGVGVKFSYDRSMLDLASAGLSVAGMEMNAKDCYQINHKYSAHAVYRAYIPIAGSKRISMFADVRLGGSYKEGKAYNAASGNAVGSFEQTYSAELAVDPGIAAFLADRLSVELNVGLFGVNYKWSDQIQNQVDEGRFRTANTGFMVNLLSLGVGLSYYFL